MEKKIMATAIEEILEALEEACDDLKDAYSGKTKVSATRARKALMTVKEKAHEARQEVLAIKKGDQDPVTDLELRLACCVETEVADVEEETEE